MTVTKKLKSLLDVSQVTEMRLTVQYRVPRDIADILNTRIYSGNYQTAKGSGMVNKGLSFVHVKNANDARKYVNPSEVETILDLVADKSRASRRGKIESLMILTPVSWDIRFPHHIHLHNCLYYDSKLFILVILV